MKKIILQVLGIIMLAGLVSASLFYLVINTVKPDDYWSGKKTEAQTAVNDIRQKKTEVIPAKFPVSGDKIKILFLGDLMFDRYIRQVSEKNGNNFVFQKVQGLLRSEDLVVGNLEGPITDKASVSVASELGSRENYIFTFPPQTAADLFRENIKLVNIGNNHILNQGLLGLAETKKYLTDSEVDYFGDPKELESRLKIYDLGELKIAFVAYDQFMQNSKQQALDELKNARTQCAGIVILYTHWGEEYVSEPGQEIRILAHEFIDSGADLIVGSHPHVIQTKEIYKDKVIYYSLGNFIFDQYFRFDTQKGMGVEATIDPKTKTIDFKEYTFTLLKNGQTVMQK